MRTGNNRKYLKTINSVVVSEFEYTFNFVRTSEYIVLLYNEGGE